MPERNGGNKFSRRELLSFFKPKNSKIDTVPEKNDAVDPWSLKISRRDFMTSAACGSLLSIADIPLAIGLMEIGIPQGNAGASEEDYNELFRNPAYGYLLTSIISPLIEESLCRAFPSETFAPKDNKMHWEVGAPASLAFMLMHNIDGAYLGVIPNSLSFEEIHVTSFISGLMYWKFEREGGLAKAAVAHGAHNATLFTLGLALIKS